MANTRPGFSNTHTGSPTHTLAWNTYRFSSTIFRNPYLSVSLRSLLGDYLFSQRKQFELKTERIDFNAHAFHDRVPNANGPTMSRSSPCSIATSWVFTSAPFSMWSVVSMERNACFRECNSNQTKPNQTTTTTTQEQQPTCGF